MERRWPVIPADSLKTLKTKHLDIAGTLFRRNKPNFPFRVPHLQVQRKKKKKKERKITMLFQDRIQVVVQEMRDAFSRASHFFLG